MQLCKADSSSFLYTPVSSLFIISQYNQRLRDCWTGAPPVTLPAEASWQTLLLGISVLLFWFHAKVALSQLTMILIYSWSRGSRLQSRSSFEVLFTCSPTLSSACIETTTPQFTKDALSMTWIRSESVLVLSRFHDHPTHSCFPSNFQKINDIFSIHLNKSHQATRLQPSSGNSCRWDHVIFLWLVHYWSPMWEWRADPFSNNCSLKESSLTLCHHPLSASSFVSTVSLISHWRCKMIWLMNWKKSSTSTSTP